MNGGTLTNAAFSPQAPRLDDLVAEIRKRRAQPEDRYEVAAMLESIGWNDARTRTTFGYADVFELADALWDMLQETAVHVTYKPEIRMARTARFIWLIRQFIRGILFAVPMGVSVAAMLYLKFSLWSYEYLTLDLATSIAIGTIASFVVVGGFTQAIARCGFFYITLGYYNMARRITFRFIKIGFVVCVLVCFLMFVTNLIFGFFPFTMFGYIVLYFFFLNSIWLSVTVMYILQKELVFTGLITLGIALVYFLFRIVGFESIVIPQLISLGVVSIIGLMLVTRFFYEAERKMDKGITPQLPRLSITIYSVLHYFAYGLLYFSFLFVDRILAWSTVDEYMPFIIWFRGQYELGLDFALLAIILPMGVSEVIVSQLMLEIEAAQRQYEGDQTGEMNRRFLARYRRRLIETGIIGLAGALLYYAVTSIFFHLNPHLIGIHLFEKGVTRFVYLWALGAYVVLAIGLLNSVILLSLAQPRLVVNSIWPAFVGNVVVGFLASRWSHFAYSLWSTEPAQNPGYAYSVIGLFIGAVVFVYFSTRNVVRVIRDLDYYLYAAS